MSDRKSDPDVTARLDALSEPALTDDDAPELTDEWFARARPAREVLPPAALEAFRRHRAKGA